MNLPAQMMRPTDAVMATSAGAAVFGWLPDLLSGAAAFLSIVWFALRIWESETVKGWRGK